MLVGLELGDLLLPIGVEDVAVVARETLIDLRSLAVWHTAVDFELAEYILPRASEQLWVGSVALGGNLDRLSARGSWW